jgi:hypothetical protein
MTVLLVISAVLGLWLAANVALMIAAVVFARPKRGA